MPVLSRLFFAGRRWRRGEPRGLPAAEAFRKETPDAGPGLAVSPVEATSPAQSRCSAIPGSDAQPDRLSPQSQSLFQGYGSVLPTSLTYIGPATRGCSPWRPAADMGTVWHENHTPSLGFSRTDGRAPDSARDALLSGTTIPISG